MNNFFIMPINCGKILYSKSNVQNYHNIDSIFNKLFKPKLYNYFICEKGVVLFEKQNEIKETIIFYDDKDFLKKLPKKPYDFYLKALEEFLKQAKEKLKKEKIYLYFDDYKFELSKKSFYAYKNENLIVHNFFSGVEYTEMDEVVINPFTNKKIKFFAPKIVYEFFKFYSSIYEFKNNEKNIKRKNVFLLLFYDILCLIIFVGLSVGGTILFWYIDSEIFQVKSTFRQVIEGVFAIAIAEMSMDFFKSKVYY